MIFPWDDLLGVRLMGRLSWGFVLPFSSSGLCLPFGSLSLGFAFGFASLGVLFLVVRPSGGLLGVLSLWAFLLLRVCAFLFSLSLWAFFWGCLRVGPLSFFSPSASFFSAFSSLSPSLGISSPSCFYSVILKRLTCFLVTLLMVLLLRNMRSRTRYIVVPLLHMVILRVGILFMLVIRNPRQRLRI